MRYLAVVLATLILTACNTAPSMRTESPAPSPTVVIVPQQQETSLDSVVEFLLTSAAKDFHDNGPSGPLRFREVHVGHLTSANGEGHYMLCGEFLSTKEGNTDWISFATIKTSGYEQWNGAHADGYCQRASVKWDSEGDLSPTLQSRFDSLRQGTK